LFFKVSTPDGPLDYQKAISGELKLVPSDDQVLATLEGDYQAMVEAVCRMKRMRRRLQSSWKAAAKLPTKSTPRLKLFKASIADSRLSRIDRRR